MRTGRWSHARKFPNLPRSNGPDEQKTTGNDIFPKFTDTNEIETGKKRILQEPERNDPIAEFRNLHEKKIEQLTQNQSSNDLVEYVLKTMNILDNMASTPLYNRHDILENYIQNYYPDLYQKQKRSLMNFRKYRCKFCEGDIETAIREGDATCSSCGLLALEGTGGNGLNITSYNHNYCIKRVHLYSKIVHFKDYICLLWGTRNGHIHQHCIEKLQKLAQPPLLINPDWIIQQLKIHNMTKLQKHAPRLAMTIGHHWKPVEMTGIQFYNILKKFRKIELFHKYMDKPTNSKRKVFLSYPYTFYRICELLGYYHLLRDCKLLKSRKLIKVQDCLWQCVCKHGGLKYLGDLDYLGIYK